LFKGEIWQNTIFYHADTLPYWHKRKNFPQKPVATGDAGIKQLATLISHNFHQTEGLGDDPILSVPPTGRHANIL